MKTQILKPLSGKSGAIFEELEKRFTRGHYKFGDPLSPIEIASEFEVSLQPMRAALGQLRALGFVIITPQVGCRVVSPTEEDIYDFFRLFGKMEGVIAMLAAERHEAVDTQTLEEATRALLCCRIPERGLPDNYSHLVGEWHTIVRSMARSPALTWRLKSAWNMSDFMLWQGAPNISRKNILVANAQRVAIKNSIISGNASIAEKLMFEHVYNKPLRAGILKAK